jgi:hypothetical protein
MKKTLFFIAIFFLMKITFSFSQTTINKETSNIYKIIPQEKIYLHYNTTFLFAGEHFYYKIYCLNANDNSQSTISKVAYVTLIGADKSIVFKHKILLKEGLGQGDFFVPTSIATGDYKLIAYTLWMRNLDQDQYFQSDISIINPFKVGKNQVESNKIIKKVIDTLVANNKSLTELKQNDNIYLNLDFKSDTYKSRKKVILKIKSLKDSLSFGNYSLSVRKIDTLDIPRRITATSFLSNISKKESLSTLGKKYIYLPEIRGELFSGKVIDKKSKVAVPNTKVAISLPGKQPLTKIATTNNSGVFYFNIQKEYESPFAIIQVLKEDRKNYDIELIKNTPLNYKKIKFRHFDLNSKMENYILKRSIYNQIENVYSDLKQNRYLKKDTIIPFYNSKTKVYLLDDYTRFPTIDETVTEIINEVFIRHKKGNITFHVKLYNQLFETDLLPLVLVDGILIQNHNELRYIKTEKIKKISVVDALLLYDSESFKGIISIETFKGDYKTNISGSFIKKVSLFKPLNIKEYFKQDYEDSQKYDRIPDFRSQLLWLPHIKIDKEIENFSFYTSDNTGDYEICLEGFTKKGLPVSIRKVFSVK